jgi:hypothetical protein
MYKSSISKSVWRIWNNVYTCKHNTQFDNQARENMYSIRFRKRYTIRQLGKGKCLFYLFPQMTIWSNELQKRKENKHGMKALLSVAAWQIFTYHDKYIIFLYFEEMLQGLLIKTNNYTYSVYTPMKSNMHSKRTISINKIHEITYI